jgi:hypothetical protein
LNIIAIVRHIRPQDVLDILFITIVVYYLYIWFRSTKAFKALNRPACTGNHIHRCPDLGLIPDDMDVPDSMAGVDYSADNIVST